MENYNCRSAFFNSSSSLVLKSEYKTQIRRILLQIEKASFLLQELIIKEIFYKNRSNLVPCFYCYKIYQQTKFQAIKMNKKLLTIQVLKQRITNMQRDLNKLEKDTSKPKRSVSKSLSQPKDHSSSPIRKTNKNKRYKSPTFWTGNPILGLENKYIAQMNPPSPKKQKRNQSFLLKSPIKQKIMRQVDLTYYQSAPQKITPEKQGCSKYDSLRTNSGNKNQNKMLELFARNFPKVQKVKTYEYPKKDPILNPEPPKISSKKITNPIPRSPKNMLVENPNSNPNLYFNSTQPINLSPKISNNRNKSPGLKLLLSSSLQNLGSSHQTPPKQTGKKHYTKYFQDNFESKWLMHW